jgi:hypothetical protein
MEKQQQQQQAITAATTEDNTKKRKAEDTPYDYGTDFAPRLQLPPVSADAYAEVRLQNQDTYLALLPNSILDMVDVFRQKNQYDEDSRCERKNSITPIVKKTKGGGSYNYYRYVKEDCFIESPSNMCEGCRIKTWPFQRRNINYLSISYRAPASINSNIDLFTL